MKTHLVPIGNSKGVRIPQSLLKTCGLEGDIEMTICKDGLLLKPIVPLREGWEVKFKEMADKGDDGLLLEETSNWDETEWEWE